MSKINNKRKEPTWTVSNREEIISALWFTTAFSSSAAGFPIWVFLLFLTKAIADFTMSIIYACKELEEEKNQNTNQQDKAYENNNEK